MLLRLQFFHASGSGSSDFNHLLPDSNLHTIVLVCGLTSNCTLLNGFCIGCQVFDLSNALLSKKIIRIVLPAYLMFFELS